MGFRPLGYGRATIFSLRINQRGFYGPDSEGAVRGPEGLLDVKGTGVWSWSTANFRQHGNGLLTLNEAICEILFQEHISKVFR